MNKINNDETLSIIKQVFFFPIYYFIYIYYCLKNIQIKIINKKNKNDLLFNLMYMFIGLLTINFFIFILKEVEIYKLDYNLIINEVYFILFYIKQLSLFIIYSIILSITSYIISKKDFLIIFKSALIFSIKVFNIFFPFIILLLIYQFQQIYVFEIPYPNSLEKFKQMSHKDLYIFYLDSMSRFIMFSLIIYQTSKFLRENYKLKKYKRRFFSILILISSILINIFLYNNLPKFEISSLMHKYELCKEKIDNSLFQSSKYNNCEITFQKYQVLIKECQSIIK